MLSYLIPLGYSTVTFSIAWFTGIAALNPIQTADAFSRFFVPHGRHHWLGQKLRHHARRRNRLAGWILHASSNHFIQQFFDPMTAYTDRSRYILGEFGFGFTFIGCLACRLFLDAPCGSGPVSVNRSINQGK